MGWCCRREVSALLQSAVLCIKCTESKYLEIVVRVVCIRKVVSSVVSCSKGRRRLCLQILGADR